MKTVRQIFSFLTAAPGLAQSYVFDRLYGVSTREQNLIGFEGDNNPYTCAQWLPVRRALRALDPKPGDVFVDLGSGKGKVLLIAGRLSFGRVIGVELNDELNRCAQENLARAADRLRAREVKSTVSNVLEWPMPDDLSVIFMFNPFVGETFRGLAGRAFESYDRAPRDLHIVYDHPVEHDWLISTGRVVVKKVKPANWPPRPGWWSRGDVIVTYRVVSPSQGASIHGEAMPSRSGRSFQHWSSQNGSNDPRLGEAVITR